MSGYLNRLRRRHLCCGDRYGSLFCARNRFQFPFHITLRENCDICFSDFQGSHIAIFIDSQHFFIAALISKADHITHLYLGNLNIELLGLSHRHLLIRCIKRQ